MHCKNGLYFVAKQETIEKLAVLLRCRMSEIASSQTLAYGPCAWLVVGYNQRTEGSKVLNKWSKFCQKYMKKTFGRALEMGPGEHIAPGRA